MASICPMCSTAHDGTCMEAERRGAQLRKNAEHHLEHCDHCETYEDAYWHVLKLRDKSKDPRDIRVT